MAIITEPPELTVKAGGNGNGSGSTVAETLGLDPGIKGVSVNVMTPQLELPGEAVEKTTKFLRSYAGFLKDRTDSYVDRVAELAEAKRRNGDALTRAGGPTTFLNYSYWNGFTAGPFQIYTDPAWRPGKIIAAGELAIMLGVVFVNPAPDLLGGGIPGTVALSGHNYRVRFETINLTTVNNELDFTFAGTFGAFPPALNFFLAFFVPANPGLNPNLYETNMTADITDAGQPFALVSTDHYDPDTEPGFFFISGTAGPEIQHDRACRYLVYNPV
ncbi:MAG: hypothetical protein ACE5IY_05200 [bacterium]